MEYLNQIGITEDNKMVMDGIFKFYSTHGIPLDIVFQLLKENNKIPCWPTFFLEARENGWNDKTIISRIKDPIIDVWGKEFYEKWLEKVNEIFDL